MSDRKENNTEIEPKFIGKKVEKTLFLTNVTDLNKECKICKNKSDLTKCIKCSNYYCKECIKQINRSYLNKLKLNVYICTNCQNNEIKKQKQEISNLLCLICKNKY